MDQYRYRYAPNNGALEYPAPRVLIDYYLSSQAAGEIKLEILNSKNQVIRAFTSARPPSETGPAASAPNMATGFITAGFSDNLKKTPGIHRFAWDMRHLMGPIRAAFQQRGADGGAGGVYRSA